MKNLKAMRVATLGGDSGGAAYYSVNFNVPQNTHWLVWGFTHTPTTGAGRYDYMGINYQDYLYYGEAMAETALVEVPVSLSRFFPFVLPPSATLIGVSRSGVNGNYQGVFRVLYYEVNI